MDRKTAKIIYHGVFLPRITYAAEIWHEGTNMIKSIAKLNSMQRASLLAITSAYKTASTNCLTAVAGEMPLALKIKDQLAKRRLKAGKCTYTGYMENQTFLLNVWQDRYGASDKGEWTKKMIPSVIWRYSVPLELDHQFLTGHGDFRAKLHSFKLVNSPTCECSLGARRR